MCCELSAVFGHLDDQINIKQGNYVIYCSFVLL